MTIVNKPPATGDAAEDAWKQEVVDAINNGVGTGTGQFEQVTQVTPSTGDSINSATVDIFQRTSTPVAPSGVARTLQYNYASSMLQDVNQPTATDWDGWFRLPPSANDGQYLWFQRVYIAEAGSTEDIAQTAWSLPTLFDASAVGTSPQLIIITRRIYDGTMPDPLSWDLHPDGEFRNSLGDPVALVATAYNGETQYTPEQHDTLFTYTWTRNGLPYIPTVAFPDGSAQSNTRRYYLIGPDDISDEADQFEVDIPEI